MKTKTALISYVKATFVVFGTGFGRSMATGPYKTRNGAQRHNGADVHRNLLEKNYVKLSCIGFGLGLGIGGTGKMRVAKLRVGILRVEVRASMRLVSPQLHWVAYSGIPSTEPQPRIGSLIRHHFWRK